MITRRMIPEKLLVVPVEEKQGLIQAPKTAKLVIDAKIVMAGRAPEGEYQPKDGDLIKYSRGGQPVNIDGVDVTLINYSQILYFP